MSSIPTPEKIDDRDDGLVVWRFTDTDGTTVDVEAASADAATTAYDNWKDATTTEIAAVNEARVLAQRNRWLFETDPYNLAGGAIADLPTDVQATVAANLPVIKAWRQQLRDYPDTVTDWTQPPPLPSPPAINLSSGKPLFRLT